MIKVVWSLLYAADKMSKKRVTLYSIITPFDALKYHIFENIIENGSICSGENALFSIIFSKVFKTLLKFFLNYFSMLSKNRNDVMI